MPADIREAAEQIANAEGISLSVLARLALEERVHRHRRARTAAVVDYQERSVATRRTVLDELTRGAVEDGTAYGIVEFIQIR